jgi:hypothetical protein
MMISVISFALPDAIFFNSLILIRKIYILIGKNLFSSTLCTVSCLFFIFFPGDGRHRLMHPRPPPLPEVYHCLAVPSEHDLTRTNLKKSSHSEERRSGSNFRYLANCSSPPVRHSCLVKAPLYRSGFYRLYS